MLRKRARRANNSHGCSRPGGLGDLAAGYPKLYADQENLDADGKVKFVKTS
jgi:hypothetical protein